MTSFMWRPAFDVHVEAMNDQHRTLIDRMNDVEELRLAEAPTAQVAAAIDRLITTALAHFDDEERYMESIGYPSLAMHRTVHRQLREKLERHLADFQANGRLNDDFSEFLWKWLASHIVAIDAKYGAVGAAA